jgi:AcrR family transcriptional regulator
MRKNEIRIERQRHRIEENKRFILKAAEKVFAKKGYSLTKVDDIAEEAQFSKATLYRYFRSKSEIFFEIVISSFDDAHQKVKKIRKKKLSAEEKLRELIFYISSYYHKKKNLARILMMERSAMKKVFNLDSKDQLFPSSHHPKIPTILKSRMEDIFNIMCEIIHEGIESGEFRKVDVRDACFVLGAMIRGFHFRGPMRDKEYSVNESTNLLHSFFLEGIKKERKT